MASVFNRGSAATPRWYASYRDAEGVWRSVPTRQPSKTAARKVALALEAQARLQQLGMVKGPAAAAPPVLCGEVMRRWLEGDRGGQGPRQWMGLTNRNGRRDALRVRRHLLPRFADVPIADVTPQYLIGWLQEEANAGKLAESTRRVHLSLLSRFFSQCVVWNLIPSNPVRSIPGSSRPQPPPKAEDVPWIDDDALVATLMAALPAPYSLMFYLGNRSGLRPGELCGLRLEDLAALPAKRLITVRHSYGGRLKEDKGKGTGRHKVKRVPAPGDWQEVLGPWVARRRMEGASEGDLVFPGPRGRILTYDDILHRWKRAQRAVGRQDLTFYLATRHSCASRLLSRGVPLAEVSRLLGHSSEAITLRHYAHWVQEAWSPEFHSGLTPPAQPLPSPAQPTASRRAA